MKRLVPIAVAFAIVAVLLAIKVRSRTPESPEPEGSWELADEDTPGRADTTDSP